MGKVPSAISHSSGRHEQHRGSDLPQLGRVKHRAEAARPQLETALAPGIYVVAIEAKVHSPRLETHRR